MGPVRRLSPTELASRAANQIDPISFADFEASLKTVLPSVSKARLAVYQQYSDSRKAGGAGGSGNPSVPPSVPPSAGGGFLSFAR
jgi:hypothetical protein